MSLFAIIIIVMIVGVILPSLNEESDVLYWLVSLIVNMIILSLGIVFLLPEGGWTLNQLVGVVLAFATANTLASILSIRHLGSGLYVWFAVLVISLIIWVSDLSIIISQT